MQIAVNTRLLIHGREDGIARFSYEILKRITTGHKECRFLFLFDRPFHEEFIFSDNVTPLVLSPPARHPFLWYLFFEQAVPRNLRRHRPSLFFSPDGWLSLSTEVKSVPVIHDLHYAHYPQFLPYWVRKYYQYYFPKFVNRADRIITVSEFSKSEIAEKYRVMPDKITVAPNGSRDEFKQLDIETINETKGKYSKGCPYFIFIGPLHPRKNPENLVKAFRKFKSEVSSDVKLLLVGANLWRGFGDLALDEDDDIIRTGYVQPAELKALLGSALALCYVSYYEGFGMPVLEAMSCGVPVIASQKASLPEVASDAAEYIDPHSAESICEALKKIHNDPQRRKALVEKGRINISRFSWDNSAAIIWNTLQQACK